jgi:hypothetical protein
MAFTHHTAAALRDDTECATASSACACPPGCRLLRKLWAALVLGCGSAGINRHGGEDERALRRKGLASRDGPESCIGVGDGVGEALTGVRVGGLLSREIKVLGC